MPTPKWLDTANFLYLADHLGAKEFDRLLAQQDRGERAVTTVNGRRIYLSYRRFYRVEDKPSIVFQDLEGAMLYALRLPPGPLQREV